MTLIINFCLRRLVELSFLYLPFFIHHQALSIEGIICITVTKNLNYYTVKDLIYMINVACWRKKVLTRSDVRAHVFLQYCGNTDSMESNRKLPIVRFEVDFSSVTFFSSRSKEAVWFVFFIGLNHVGVFNFHA